MKARIIVGSAIASLLFLQTVHSSVYLVQKNDTVWSIARKFGVQTEPISRINDLVGRQLKVGQKLVIPDRLMDYTVQNGDTLTRIARVNGSKLPYIILYNNLPDERLLPGKKIVIPVTERETAATAPVTERTFPAERPVVKRSAIHRVAKGDTLTSLSERYNVSIGEIMDWNKKRTASIFIGEKLRILTGTQDSKEAILAKTENIAPVRKEWSASSKVSDPSSYEFPISWSLVDHISRSGRGVIVYIDAVADIASIHDGTVEYSGKMTGYNSVVIINCGDNERAIYGFLDEVRVKEGDRVSKKQPLGTVSRATYLGTIQFYFELRKGKENVNIPDVFPALRNKELLAKN